MRRAVFGIIFGLAAVHAQDIKLHYEAFLDVAAFQPGRPAAISANASQFAAGGPDGSVRVWRLDQPGPAETIKVLGEEVKTIAFETSGVLIAAGQSGARAIDTGSKKSEPLWWPAQGVSAFAITPAAVALAKEGSSEVEVYSRGDRRLLRSFRGHSSPVFGLAFSPDGQRIASGELFRVTRLWSMRSSCLQQNIPNRSSELRQISFSRDGRWLAVVSESGIQIADAVSGTEMHRFYPRSGSFVAAAFDDYGAVVALSSDAGLRLWRSDRLPFLTAGPPKPALHILVAGINAYADPSLRLGFAQQDAELAAIFEQNGAFLAYEPHATRVVGDCATKSEVLSAFRELAQVAKAEDAVLVFLAGHGRQENNNFWYYTQRFHKTGSLQAEAISSAEIAKLMATVPASRQVLILDACQSGSAVESIARTFTTFGSRSRRLQVLSASASTEDAMEVEEKGHGLLTSALLEGFTTLKTAVSARPTTVSAWLQHAVNRVPALAAEYNKSGSQKPVLQVLGSDFALFAAAAPVPPAVASSSTRRSTPPPEFSGPLSCRPTAADKTFIRPEGIAELMGDIVFRCAGEVTSPRISLTLYFNSNFTSRDLGGGRIEASLVTEAPGTRTDLLRAELRAGQLKPKTPNAIQWDDVPVPSSQGMADVQFRLTGLRVNASGLGASATLVPTQAFTYYEVRVAGTNSVMKQQVSVAFIAGPLVPRLGDCSAVATPALSLESTIAQNPELARGVSQQGRMQFAVSFVESYPEHFLPSLARLRQQTLPNGLSLAADSFDQGTRLMMRLNNIPAGIELYATVAGLRGVSNPTIRARMVTTDAGGSGAYQVVKGSFTGVCGASEVGVAKLQISDSTALAVWEVLGSDPNAIERLSFGVMAAYSAQPPPMTGQVVFTGEYAPVSTIVTASDRAPIPRFARGSERRNIFSVSPPVLRLLFPVTANVAGYDSAIEIRNTSLYPGGCMLAFRPMASSLAKPAPVRTDAPVLPGATLTYVFSNGGTHGLIASPGFAGCVEATCNFESAAARSRMFEWGRAADGVWTNAMSVPLDASASWVDGQCKQRQDEFRATLPR